MPHLMKDENGAPYPEVWALWNPRADPPLYLPYPGGYPTGGREVVDRYVEANPTLGYKAVRCQLVPIKEADPGPRGCVEYDGPCLDPEACATGHSCDSVHVHATTNRPLEAPPGVIMCGGEPTEGDLKAVREFAEFLEKNPKSPIRGEKP